MPHRPSTSGCVAVTQSPVLGKGEPTMRSHWTNPTIIRRPTIAALSAAALLVACDQPAGPSRPGGGIVADAQAGTISAKGNAQVAEALDCATGFPLCIAGGQGADVSVD